MNKGNLFQNTRSTIQKLIDETKIPSIAVGVAYKEEILWMEGFGFANIDKKIPATEHTVYPLASISKAFTATGLMILKERGLLNLDKPVQHYLPDLQINYHHGSTEELTIRSLANHSAGLPTHFNYHYSDDEGSIYSIPETVQQYGNIIAPPMERCLYANLGFGVLGHLLTKVSGMSYAEFMQLEIFKPLGMKDSHVFDQISHEENDVVFYGPDDVAEFDENGQPRFVQYGSSFEKIPYSECDTPGAAAVSSSVHDLIKFGLFHMNGGPVLSRNSLDEMKQPTSAPTIINAPPSAFINENTRYGVGWRISRLNGYEIVWHDGGMSGTSTKLVLVPSENFVIVALCNRFQPQITDQVVSSIISELLPQGPLPQKSPTFLSTNAPISGEWTGTIHTNEEKVPLTLWINENGDAFSKLGEDGKQPFYISKVSNSYFWGVFKGNLTTEDTKQYPHDLSLDLKLRDEVLDGFVLATCIKTPNNRMGYALCHWTELRKV